MELVLSTYFAQAERLSFKLLSIATLAKNPEEKTLSTESKKAIVVDVIQQKFTYILYIKTLYTSV